MATSEPDIKTKIAELRHEILSYKPGKAVPRADKLIVFPDLLVIGVIDVRHQSFYYSHNIVHAMRSALHGDEAIKYADRHETSTQGQEKYLTDSISVIESIYDYYGLGQVEKGLRRPNLQDLVIGGYAVDFAAKVGCVVALMDASE